MSSKKTLAQVSTCANVGKNGTIICATK